MTKNMSRVLVGPKFPFPAGRNAADHRLGTGGAGGDSGSSRGRGGGAGDLDASKTGGGAAGTCAVALRSGRRRRAARP